MDLVEILDLALQLESCGEYCYRTAAERLPPGPVRRMMEALAEQEVGHTGRFQELLGESVVEEMFRDAESEVATKLLQRVSLAELLRYDLHDIGKRVTYILHQRDAVVRDLSSFEKVEDLVNFSLFLEETAVLLYEALLKYVSGPVARSWVRSVLSEEKAHLKSFQQLKSDLRPTLVA